MFEQTFRKIDDVLWKEVGCGTQLDYTEPAEDAIDKLRNHGIVPTGSGKRMTGQDSFEL